MKRLAAVAILALLALSPSVAGAVPPVEIPILEVVTDTPPLPIEGPLVLVREEAPPKVDEGPNDTAARVVSTTMLPVVGMAALASITLGPLAAVELAGGTGEGCWKDAACAGFTPGHSVTLIGGIGVASSVALIVSAADLEDREIAQSLTIVGSVGLTLSAASLGLGLAALVREMNLREGASGATVQLPLVSGSF